MSYNNDLVLNNLNLSLILDEVNALPEAGSGDEDAQSVADSIVDGSITELTSNVTSIKEYAFRNCDKLVTASFPKATTIGTYAFNNCDLLTTVTAPNVTTIATYAFYQSMKLSAVVFPKLTAIAGSVFGNCTGLVKADFTAATSIASGAFTNDTKLTALILRGNSVCSLASTGVFTNSAIATVGKGFVYVPSSLVDSYKAASNWSTYADNIRAIEDYPEITGG